MGAIQKVGDPISCGDAHAEGSHNVYINGVSVARAGDLSTGHSSFPPTPAIEGSASVFVNGLPVVRNGDAYAPHTNSDGETHVGAAAGLGDVSAG
jgi:uncharacterized Zn-binding protein involved in type VI secretion